MTLIVSPACYAKHAGKRWTQATLKAAWKDGQDFLIRGPIHHPDYGRYVSSRDTDALKRQGIQWINIRYNDDRDVYPISL